MALVLPTTIDIRISQDCNKKCEFCFGTRIKGRRTIDNWDELLSKFKMAGVKRIVITGGEPSLIPELGEMVRIARKMGLTICLSTNGAISFRSDKDSILKNLDWISIPLEGNDYDVHRLLRTETVEEYAELLNLMRYAKEKYHLGVKVGTVVTSLNAKSIDLIPSIIHLYADNWKLYQVYLAGKNSDIVQKYAISRSEYYTVYDNCRKICEKYANLNCISYDVTTMNGKYLFCEPNADAMTIFQDKEYVIGNFLDSFEMVCNRWTMYVNNISLEKNYQETFGRKMI